MMQVDNLSASEFHDRLASAWDLNYEKRSFRQRARRMFELLAEVPLRGTEWLDAGCGTGRLSRELLLRGASVHGVDAAPAMVKEARKLAVSLELRDNQTVVFDAIDTVEALPMQSNRFHGVLCSSVLEYLQWPGRCLSEFYRVLRPGGYLMISVPNRNSVLRQSIKCGDMMTRRFTSGSRLGYMRHSLHEYTSAEFRKFLYAHGFRPVGYNFAGTPLPALLDRLPRVGSLINVLARRVD